MLRAYKKRIVEAFPQSVKPSAHGRLRDVQKARALAYAPVPEERIKSGQMGEIQVLDIHFMGGDYPVSELV